MTFMRSFQCLLCVVVFSLSSNANAQLEINWFTVDGGGGSASGGEFELVGTIGQFDAGITMSNGEFDLAGGFWANTQTEQTLLGDCNLDGEVNLFDIAPFIAILTTNGSLAEADCNQDGEVNLFDIAAFIAILTTP